MKTLISWLGDVYQHNGYVAVLIAIAVIVGLALIVAKVGGVNLGDIVAWIGGGAINRLTPTGEYVLKLITHGYESKDIAKILRISERTVQGTHVCSLHSKLYTRNRVQLALYALRNGLVRLEDIVLLRTPQPTQWEPVAMFGDD